MQSDYSIELGPDGEVLEVPWSSPGGELRYYDLKRRPELLLNVQEAAYNQELGEFLAALNSANSIFETARCDTWLSNEIQEEEKIYQAEWKFGSYVDLILAPEVSEEDASDPSPRLSIERHEGLAKSICALLKRVPEISSSAEFIIRRCYFRRRADDPKQHDAGFCITFYLFGYGDDENDARMRWCISLKVIENALLQLSAMERRKAREAIT